VLRLDQPTVQSRIVLVTIDEDPGSVLARTLVETARRLRIDDLFDHAPDANAEPTATT